MLLKKPPSLISCSCCWSGVSLFSTRELGRNLCGDFYFFFFLWNILDGDPCDKHKLLPSSPHPAIHACWLTKRNGKGFRMESFILYRGICIRRCQKWSLMCTTPPWDFAVASCAGDPWPVPASWVTPGKDAQSQSHCGVNAAMFWLSCHVSSSGVKSN